MGSPFDRALEQREFERAAVAYASARGAPGTPEYRAAWLYFRRRVQTGENLRRARAKAVARRARAR